MPTYDYRCQACGHTVELVHSILEDGPTACEQCGGPVQRVVHATGVIFRGSGFYVTDSRSSSKAAAEKAAEKGSDGSGSTKAGKSGSGSGSGTSD